MILHLGGDFAVMTEDIIGIFDFDKCSYSRITKNFLNKCQKERKMQSVSAEIPRTFVLSENNGNFKVHTTQISSAALSERVNSVGFSGTEFLFPVNSTKKVKA